MSVRVAVVGTINRDRIILPGGETHRNLGGILYNVLPLQALLRPNVTVLPIAKIGEESRAEVDTLLDGLSRIDRSSIYFNPEGSNETVLRYISRDEREERLIERIHPFTWEEIRPAAECDKVLVNMIWGKEVTPSLLHRLVDEGGPDLILDIQSLTLTFRSGGDRMYRNIPEWREWVKCATTVKGNEGEILWFTGDEGPFRGSVKEAAFRILDAGPSTVLITQGTAGHAIGWREGRKRRWMEVPPVPVPEDEVADTTGCGDVFTSGYVAGLLRGEEPLHASLLASTIASLACRTRGLRELLTLPDPFHLRRKYYPENI